MAVKLGKRLRRIESMADEQYDHIWDCCCDHGLLGQGFLEREPFAHIHFVDIVPQLMKVLQGKLKKSYGELSARWSVHCCHVENIPLKEKSERHLIILAGVGGDLTQEFMISLCEKYADVQIDFILCPVYHQFDLRKKLRHLNLTFRDECLVQENKRFYEIIMVSNQKYSTSKDREISVVGEGIWTYTNEEEKRIARGYLKKILRHYDKKKDSQPELYLSAFEAYKGIVV